MVQLPLWTITPNAQLPCMTITHMTITPNMLIVGYSLTHIFSDVLSVQYLLKHIVRHGVVYSKEGRNCPGGCYLWG